MKISADYVAFDFCRDNKEATRVTAPADITIDTKDCFSNQLRKPSDEIDQLDWNVTNPATGPIYVEGAEPGDTLKVTVKSIRLDDQGVVCCIEDEGVLGHRVKGSYVAITPVRDGKAFFLDKIEIPVNPMIGVIGVAPASGSVNTGTPAEHGGNMDNKMIGEGAILYLPVAVEGALFALGDVHAVMGDGEIGVTGLEIAAEVDVQLDVIKGKQYEYPIMENRDSFSIIASKSTVDKAAETATELMLDFLKERVELSESEIIMLMSLVGNLEICQVVDPNKTVRFVFPKKYMQTETF